MWPLLGELEAVCVCVGGLDLRPLIDGEGHCTPPLLPSSISEASSPRGIGMLPGWTPLVTEDHQLKGGVIR